MKKSFTWLIPAVILLICIACSKKGSTTETPPVTIPDTTKPVINLIDPTVGKLFVLGSTLHLQMDLSDNVELKSYKVTISKSQKGVQTSDWAYANTWILATGKKSITINHSEILVPLTVTGNQTTTGNYDMLITCTDLAGNEMLTTVTIALTK